MNGFLDYYRGGKIEVMIYNNTSKKCSDFLNVDNPVQEKEEKMVTLNIPEGTDEIKLSEENVNIKPGVKTVYAVLKNKDGEKRGHECQKAIKCASLGIEPLPDDAYHIEAGDRACVYLDIKLIP